MTVVMKGGTSGNREDALPDLPGGPNQPVLDTSRSMNNAAVHYQAQEFINNTSRAEQATPDFLPTGGTIPEGSTDVQEQGLPNPGMEGKVGWQQGTTR